MFEPAHKVRRWVKVALWGDKKTGKTRFALSFPKPCVIDTERGSLLYSDQFKFDVKDANRWKELGEVLDWLDGNPGKYQTLVIDSLTVFYQDLVSEVTDYVRNKRGNEVLTYMDWGTIKRRWKALLVRLTDLDMNVVLVMREKDEYEQTKDHNGQEITRKTGEHLPDIEKSTGYVFDFILHLTAQEDKKSKKARYMVTVDGSRRPELPKFMSVDLTGKTGYDSVFKPLESVLLEGKAAPKRDEVAPSVPEMPSTAEALGDINEMFVAAPHREDPPATSEDIKVLMTRCGQMTWPNGDQFNSKDGKALIRALYKIESSKDLKKFQVDFLYTEFGKVLAGKASLARDEKEIPYVASAPVAREAGSVSSSVE